MAEWERRAQALPDAAASPQPLTLQVHPLTCAQPGPFAWKVTSPSFKLSLPYTCTLAWGWGLLQAPRPQACLFHSTAHTVHASTPAPNPSIPRATCRQHLSRGCFSLCVNGRNE